MIKYRFPEHIIEELLQLQWWQYDYGQFKTINSDDPIKIFIENIHKFQLSHQLEPFLPKALTINDLLNNR